MHNTSPVLASVNFHGQSLTIITGPAGEHLVAMKPICEAIGLDWKSQYSRILRHPVLSTCMVVMTMQMPGDDQHRDLACLPLDYLNGWLFGVDVSRVRPEIRERLVQYQRECFAALAAYWQQGEAVSPRRRKAAAPKALPNGLSGEQQGAIKALVAARIEALPEAARGRAATLCWSALKSKFGCSYKEIAPEQFTEAVSLVARVVLDGELLEPEAPKVLGRLPIDFPIRRWLAEHPWIARRQQLVGQDQLVVSADMLYGMDARSPTLQLLAELEKADYNVSACRVEVQAMRHHLEMSSRFFRDIRAISDSALDHGMRLRISEPKA